VWKYLTAMEDAATVLLVHGAWCGDWIYWKLTPCLEDRDIRWVGADLPTCRATDPSVDAHDDAAYVRELIDRIDGPVVVAGKSYGGAVISGAGADPKVAHLVYIAAFMPEADEPFLRSTRTARLPEFAEGIRLLDDGRSTIDVEVGAHCAFSHATEEDRDVWRREAHPMSLGRDSSIAFPRVAWEDRPSTYVVCEQDKAIDPSAQRTWAERATNVIARPFDHSPGVSHPDEVADLLADIARAPDNSA
jgi:pimeloyl-ACP methyl ester carboxylesterase